MLLREVCALILALAAAVVTGGRASAAPAPPAATFRLAKPVDLALVDADFTAAMKALNETGVVAVRLDGTLPEHKISLTLKGMPARDVLDAVAALYGLRWEQHLTMTVFLDREPEQEAGGGPPAGEKERLREALDALRALGIGASPGVVPPSHNRLSAETVRRLAGFFTPEQRQRMLQAGEQAAEMGVYVRDLPPALQQSVLEWQRAKRSYSIAGMLSLAVRSASQPFDPERTLDAVVYIVPSSQGGNPMLTLREGSATSGFSLPRD